MKFDLKDLENIKGTRLLYVQRGTTYKVLRVVDMKVTGKSGSESWVVALEYKCEKLGKIFVRDINNFGGFVKAPKRTFLEYIGTWAWWRV